MSDPEQKQRLRRRLAWGLALVLLASVLLFVLRGFLFPPEQPDALLARARLALTGNDYAAARDLASRVPGGDSHWEQAQLIAGEACTRMLEYDAAIMHYTSIPRDHSPVAVNAALALGEIYRTTGRLTRSEQEYEYVLRHDPSNAAVHERLGHLLALTRRHWEALPHFLFLVQQEQWTLDVLVYLGDLERPLEQREYLKRCMEQVPDDPMVRLGLAANAFYVEGDVAQARELAKSVVAQTPQMPAAQAILGELLVQGEEADFLDWHARLPPNADENPNIWFVRGLWARRHGKLPLAARCFWETLRTAPTHRRANYQLGQVLISLGETGGEDFETLASRLFDLTRFLDEALRARGKNEDALKHIVELMERTGRLWEACAWARTASSYFPQANWPRTAYARMQPRLRENPSQIIPAANLALQYDLSDFPATDAALFSNVAQTSTPSARSTPASIRFEAADDVGIDFVYFNGDDPSTAGVRMFEQSGGGVAVLDVDGDRWPDLYFTQGAEWNQGAPAPMESPDLSDQLFRNIGGERFVNVTRESGLRNLGYGQGAAAGDFDGDGFPDLYVANVGRNRLYHNNGDGTFSDVTEESGLTLTDWTSSCVVVDLNADGLPDLFDVNYLTGREVYSIICQRKGCSPKVFEGLPDRLHVNRGDGTFRWIEGATPADEPKGLGVLAFDLSERGRPWLFVANDQTPNFLLRNVPSENAANIRLENEGFVRGVSYNMNGLAMACMGIAADDANGDGRLDFFVTNFEDEANTLYLQDVDGLFIDGTNAAGLASPSWPMTGWGTQFLDADLDGEPDLVVANGHVYPEEGTDYPMRAQFFRNEGRGRFAEIPARRLGSYFEMKHVGRSLARLDWNRDGRMDFAVSHIMERAALVTNTTATTGRFIGFRLHATTTSRDAIGSIVEVAAGDRRWKKQLVAGDGFQASNERLLLFGLGENDSVASIRITWPSGAVSSVRDLAADGVLEVVEGTDGVYFRNGALQSVAIEHLAAETD